MTQSRSEGLVPNEGEIKQMADVLTRRFGRKAIAVASDFALEHQAIGDRDRAGTWCRVARELDARLSHILH